MKLNTTPSSSTLLACLLALAAAPLALANDPEKKLDKYDTNNDGRLSRTEFDEAARQKFQKMDTDGDGVLSRSECESAMKDKMEDKKKHPDGPVPHNDMKRDDMGRHQELGRDHMDWKFEKMDRDSDGRITASEFSQVGEEMFGKLDGDGDGSLSRTELEHGHKMMKKEKEKRMD